MAIIDFDSMSKDPVVKEIRETTVRSDTSYHEVRASCAQCFSSDPPKPNACLIYGRDVSKQTKPLTATTLAQAASGMKTPPSKTQKLAARYAEPLNWAMALFGINSLTQRRAFVAVVVHETINLTATTEGASAHASSKLKYKGRGLIQLTHESNYRRAGEALGLASGSKNLFVDYPQIVAECPYFAAATAAWYWRYGTKWDLNDLIGDGSLTQFEKVSRCVNGGNPKGGLNHWEDRKTRYSWANLYLW
ncbi:MAG: hypothetical protein HUU55_10190 [Myxococcales bacterium]|nr:hypothetical protein [Myxococcales bacterium]